MYWDLIARDAHFTKPRKIKPRRREIAAKSHCEIKPKRKQTKHNTQNNTAAHRAHKIPKKSQRNKAQPQPSPHSKIPRIRTPSQRNNSKITPRSNRKKKIPEKKENPTLPLLRQGTTQGPDPLYGSQ